MSLSKVFYPPDFFNKFDPNELKGEDVLHYLRAAIKNLRDGINKDILIKFMFGYYYFEQIHCVGDDLYRKSNDKIPLRTNYDFKGVTIHDFYYLASQIVDFHDSFFINWKGPCLLMYEDEQREDPHKNNMKKKLIENDIIDKISQLPKTKIEGTNYYHNREDKFNEKDNTLNRNNITRSIIMLFFEAIMNKDEKILKEFFEPGFKLE